MIIICPNSDDDHAPFPHRLVIHEERHAVIRDRYSTNRLLHIYPAVTFVICTNCDHDIATIRPSCACRYNCHPDGTLQDEVPTLMVRDQIVTADTGALGMIEA